MTDDVRRPDPSADAGLDPGAYIGNEPELEAETIPGGVTSRDERVAAYQSRPGLPEEGSEASEDGPGADEAAQR
jgi:hypothetical protein